MSKTYRIYNAHTNEFMLTPRVDQREAERDVDSLCSSEGVSGRLEVREFGEGEEPPLALGTVVYHRDA